MGGFFQGVKPIATGSASAPGLPFAADPDSGIYYPAGGGFAASYNGLPVIVATGTAFTASIGASPVIAVTSTSFTTYVGTQAVFGATPSSVAIKAAADYPQLLLDADGIYSPISATHHNFKISGTDSSAVVGRGAGAALTTGNNNSFFGSSTARNITTGSHNCIFGSTAFYGGLNCNYNVVMGSNAAFNVNNEANISGNVFLGYQSGYSVRASASNNIFIGRQAGYQEGGAVSNKLYISNSSTTTPLIYGTFDAAGGNTGTLRFNASVMICAGSANLRELFTGVTPLDQVEYISNSRGGRLTTFNEASVNGVLISTLKTRGAANGAVTAVVQNDSLAQYAFWGTDGTNAIKGAYMIAGVSGVVAANVIPTFMAWGTMNNAGTTSERLRIDSEGNLLIQTVGMGFRVKEGADAKQGTAVLVAGAVVVNNTSITANSRIFLTGQVDGGTIGFPRVSARVAGTSFTITSSSALDTSTIAYEIFEPS